MEYLDAHFRQDFPLISNILLGNTPKREPFHGFSIENNTRLIGHSYTFTHCNLGPPPYNVVGSSSNPFSRVSPPAVLNSINPLFPAPDNGVFLKNNNLGQYVHSYNEPYVVHDRTNFEFRDVVVPVNNAVLPEGNFGDGLNNQLPKKPEDQRKKAKQGRGKRRTSLNASSSATVTRTNIIKGQWTAQEDRLLIQLVRQYGVRKWSQIAKNFNGRVGKQCRERWHNHLRPDIKKDTWSEEEDRILVAAHRVVGNKWAEIAKRLPGRTENSIKNHWNTTKRRELSKTARSCLYNNNGATPPNPNVHSTSSSSSYLQKYVKSVCAATPTLKPQQQQQQQQHLDNYKSRSSYNNINGGSYERGNNNNNNMEDLQSSSKVVVAGLGDLQAEYDSNSMDMEVEALLHCGVKKEMNLLDMFSINGDYASF